MKAVILAGGYGTRLSEETDLKPKPMIEIGNKPILWHIMKTYSTHNVNDFIICCGYKGYIIKEYFANYFLHMSDVTFSMKDNKMTVLQNKSEPWTVTLVDTGETSMTGGRLKAVYEYIKDEADPLSQNKMEMCVEFFEEFYEGEGKFEDLKKFANEAAQADFLKIEKMELYHPKL